MPPLKVAQKEMVKGNRFFGSDNSGLKPKFPNSDQKEVEYSFLKFNILLYLYI